MLRSVVGLATRCLVKPNIQPLLVSAPATLRPLGAFIQPLSAVTRQFSAFARPQLFQTTGLLYPAFNQLLENKPSSIVQQTRSVTKHSIKSGRRKTVKHIIRTFYRLQWGIWIRAKAGKHKRLWRKDTKRWRRAQNHVFCTATQSNMLDKMVTPFWRRPKYWVDDPYEPYHEREEYPMTRKKPLPPHTPVEN